MKQLKWKLLTLSAVFVLVSGIASAAVLTTGSVTLGVNSTGSLDDVAAGVGLNLAGVGDALIPGCPCESWGVSADAVSGYTGEATGTSNIGLTSFVSGVATATSVTTLTGSTLSITQDFSSVYVDISGGALFRDRVTITNTGGGAIGDVRFARAMDWDVPPTTFSEFVTIGGTAPAIVSGTLLYSGDNGFAVPDPLAFPYGDLAGCGENVDFVDCGPSDHGAAFVFDFGGLAAGASRTFDIFYGATYSELDAFAALGAVGAEVYSFGQANTAPRGATFIFAFAGVGGTPIPEPGSLALLGTALAAAAFYVRKRKVQA